MKIRLDFLRLVFCFIVSNIVILSFFYLLTGIYNGSFDFKTFTKFSLLVFTLVGGTTSFILSIFISFINFKRFY